jgi:hypothetical protein
LDSLLEVLESSAKRETRREGLVVHIDEVER